VRLLETALADVNLFGHLRLDEIGRIARKFRCHELSEQPASTVCSEQPHLYVVLSGLVEARVDDPLGEILLRLRPGDSYGAASVLTGAARPVRLSAIKPSQVALLDRDGLESILHDYPAVALSLVEELAVDLRKRNDQFRRVLELKVAGSPASRVQGAIAHVRKSLGLRSAGVRHVNTRGLFRRWVSSKGAEPPFWMLIGFGLGLAGSRLTVHLILKYHLEKHLFALVAGTDPNPVHIHHFNYGLLIVGITGLVSLLPYGRRALRTLSLFFGVGCALVFDEFALFWNLNPDYSQGLSLISAAIAAVVLIQIAYFRRFWLALFVRIAQWLGSE
jgi:CRP-like cAMP-binding protein